MLKKLVTVFFLLCVAFVITSGISWKPYPHYGEALAHSDVASGHSIIIEDVRYFTGGNTEEDRTEVTISGFGWNNCERIRVFYNDMRIKVFDPSSTDWTFTFVVASIPEWCSVRVEGAMSGWSNYCDFYGAAEGPVFGLLQTTQKMGTVGSKVGIGAINWRPMGLVTIFFRGIPIDRLYPSLEWETAFKVPEAPAGLWPVEVRDEGNSWKFGFQVVPNLVIEPEDVTPGQLVTITGTGFAKNTYVHLTQVEKLAFTNTVGSFRLEGIQIPSAMGFVIKGLDEEDNEAQLQITPTPVSDATAVPTPATIQVPGPSLPSVNPTYVYIVLAIVAAILLGLIGCSIFLVRKLSR